LDVARRVNVNVILLLLSLKCTGGLYARIGLYSDTVHGGVMYTCVYAHAHTHTQICMKANG